MIKKLEQEEIELISGGMEAPSTDGTEPIGIWEGWKKPWWWPWERDGNS